MNELYNKNDVKPMDEILLKEILKDQGFYIK